MENVLVILWSAVLSLTTTGGGAETAHVVTDHLAQPRTRIEADQRDLGRRYALCSWEAERRPLSHGEVQTCQNTYLHLKLSFVPEVSVEHYVQMPAPQRAEVNRRAYEAFRTWKSSQRARLGD